MLQTSASRINALILSFGHREKILSLQVSADYHIGFSSIIIIITLPTRFFCCCHNTQNCFSAVQELHFCILITGNFFFPFVKVLASCFLALLLQQYFYLFFCIILFPLFSLEERASVYCSGGVHSSYHYQSFITCISSGAIPALYL